MFKVNNKDTGATPLALFLCLYCQLWTYFTPCSSFPNVNFEHKIVGWDCYYWISDQKTTTKTPWTLYQHWKAAFGGVVAIGSSYLLLNCIEISYRLHKTSGTHIRKIFAMTWRDLTIPCTSIMYNKVTMINVKTLEQEAKCLKLAIKTPERRQVSRTTSFWCIFC